MTEFNEIEIIQRVLKGNTHAFSLILKKYENKVFTLTFRILKNREDAEEASQDAFLKCYNGLPEFNFKSSFSTWLYRIAYTCSIDKLRKNKSKPSEINIDIMSDNFDISNTNDALSKLREEEQKLYLTNALNKLDEEDSILIYFYYQEEKSIEDIASITDMSKSNIKIRLFRVRKKLFDELNKELRKEVYDLV